MNQNYMKEKPILPLLLSLSLPAMISMMVNSLYNIIDSIFVAKIGENAMTAISLVYPIQNVIISLAVGFGVGINAMIALYLGAGKKQRANVVATQGMALSIVHGILLTIIGIIIMPRFLKLFTSDFTIINLGTRYSTIALSFSVIIMISVTFEKIFQSVGKMVIAMISLTAGCIINIILDPIMIFGLGPIPAMGIEGAAWATGIGQTVTLLIYIFAYLQKGINIKLSFKYLNHESPICWKLYNIGIPASLNMALPSLLVSALNGILSTLSPMYVVVLGVYYKLQTFIYLPANGIIQGMRPIMSYNFGAGEHKRVKRIYTTSLVLILALMILGMILCFTIPRQLLGLFTSSYETIQAGVTALKIISLGFIVSSISISSSGALEALGEGIESLIISLLRYVFLIIPLAFLLSRIFGVNGVWSAFGITEAITSIIAFIIFNKSINKHVS